MSGAVLFQNANVLDVVAGDYKADQDVLVRDGKIAEIASNVGVAGDVRSIDLGWQDTHARAVRCPCPRDSVHRRLQGLEGD